MRKYWYWLLPLSWMGVIFYSSGTPYENQDIKPFLGNFIDLSFLEPIISWISFTYHNSIVSVRVLGVEGFIEFFIRKGAHVTVFFLLLCFIFLAISKTSGITFHRRMLFSFLLTVAYAILDEIHQGFTPNRTPYIGDVVIDSIGAAIAALLIMTLHSKKLTK
ncbi:VanZ family protein [Oceanobacillus chungangensis]|uniref:VanZ family protein n=1 Tax=Oceanobacillus chungangensis TaxID=1229152 RepID=A0A3D8PHT7_9BACI|nr:VanZ family protein [Oceanobacillus chungangensis]RDW15656.1 VanZ family protein [Oceanobacillus chungangensis]